MDSHDQQQLDHFTRLIWNFYEQNKRTFAWRETSDPYHIVVSEIMLQQTQTGRVVEKFESFTQKFPNWSALADATLHDVLAAWQGLGYNRRGKALHTIAQKVMHEYQGLLPQTVEELVTFPSIGPNTAGSICAFAFNKSTIFIETNIRTVYIYHFFHNQTNITDKQLLPLVEQTVDLKNPREWYYALMDYGVMLKKNTPNPSRKSAHHTTQSKFEGSDRQIRGLIIKTLTTRSKASFHDLVTFTQKEPQRIKKALDELQTEMLVKREKSFYSIA
jgi:A/G-specific adenine glycosylase